MQDYLKNEKDKIRRQLFARFRTGSHWLQVQVGRFKGAPRETRPVNNVAYMKLKTRSTVY